MVAAVREEKGPDTKQPKQAARAFKVIEVKQMSVLTPHPSLPAAPSLPFCSPATQ